MPARTESLSGQSHAQCLVLVMQLRFASAQDPAVGSRRERQGQGRGLSERWTHQHVLVRHRRRKPVERGAVVLLTIQVARQAIVVQIRQLSGTPAKISTNLGVPDFEQQEADSTGLL